MGGLNTIDHTTNRISPKCLISFGTALRQMGSKDPGMVVPEVGTSPEMSRVPNPTSKISKAYSGPAWNRVDC